MINLRKSKVGMRKSAAYCFVNRNYSEGNGGRKLEIQIYIINHIDDIFVVAPLYIRAYYDV